MIRAKDARLSALVFSAEYHLEIVSFEAYNVRIVRERWSFLERNTSRLLYQFRIRAIQVSRFLLQRLFSLYAVQIRLVGRSFSLYALQIRVVGRSSE